MSDPCTNCGKRDIAKDGTCNQCGYKKPEMKELDSATLVFCNDCGCTYMDKCGKPDHKTTKVDLNKKGA